MMSKIRSHRVISCIALVASIVIVLVVFWLVKYFWFSVSGADSKSIPDGTTEAPIETTTEVATEPTLAPSTESKEDAEFKRLLEDLKLILAVDLDEDSLSKMYSDFSKVFLDNSMPNQNAARTSAASKVGWGKDSTSKMFDAVSFPFEAVSAEKKEYTDEDILNMYRELQEEIMRNPVFGDMFAQGLKKLELQDGTSVAELNKAWLDEFEAKYNEFGCDYFVTYHTNYWLKYGFELPHDNENIESWKTAHPNAPEFKESDLELVSKDGKPVVYVTDEYVDYAKRMLCWLDRVSCLGVREYSTIKHWPLNSELNANLVRTYENMDKGYVDSYPALTFSVELKDGRRQLLFGFNIYDKRFEIYEPTEPDPVNPTLPPETSPVPETTTVIETTPEPTTVPETTPEPTTSPKKDPKQDPVHKGNADKGGGTGVGETSTKPVADPSKTDMQNAGGQPDKNQGHSDPTTVKPTNPPAETHTENPSGEDDNNPKTIEKTDSNPMDYGEEDHTQHDAVTDSDGKVSIPDEQPEAGEFDEPPI